MQPNAWLEFCHLNVRSLRTSFDLFLSTICGSSFDVIGLSETWLDTGIPTFPFSIDNYQLIRQDRDGRGGGVGFYIRNSIKYKIIINHSAHELEQLWISLKIDGKRLCLGTLYRPPQANVNQSLELLENSLVNIIPEHDHIAFGGDFNIDFLSPHSHGHQLFTNFLNKYGLIQHITEPTRITSTSGTLIDLIISSSSNIVSEAGFLNMEGISDHFMVHCKIKIPREKQIPFIKTYRDFSGFNYDDFLNDLEQIWWDEIHEMYSVDEMVEFFNEHVLHLFNIHTPIKTAKITKPPAPWLTDNLKLMIKLKNKALTKYKKHKTLAAFDEFKD